MRRQTAVGDVLFGRYRVDSLIGEGGQGTVWRGTDGADASAVAIKELTGDSPELRKRFEREMELALEHPGIIQVRHYGEEAGTYFFVMEHLDGQNLSTILERQGRLPEREAARIVGEVARALACAHAENVIHRDIKPENIMVLRDGRVKITDFGIACFKDKERVTRSGATMGTAHYMSPEQVEDVSKVDRTSDIFSLGVVLYELLSGAKPFDAELLGELYLEILTRDPVPLRDRVPGLSEAIQAAVPRMLAKKPEERFQDMDEVLAALQGAGGARGASTGDPATPGTAAAPAPAPAAAGRRKERTGIPCPSCRAINRIGSSFCGRCGADLRAACTECSAPLPAGALFCGRCGHPVAAVRPPAGPGVLVGLRGGFCGQRIPVDRDFITLGRHQSNDVSFADGRDEYVSRFQARVTRDRGAVWIEGWDWVKNAVTTNGTFVNGRNIDGKGKVALRHGDRVRLGDSFFRYEAPG
jgi:predicted Ser/Thr protein kinase